MHTIMAFPAKWNYIIMLISAAEYQWYDVVTYTCRIVPASVTRISSLDDRSAFTETVTESGVPFVLFD